MINGARVLDCGVNFKRHEIQLAAALLLEVAVLRGRGYNWPLNLQTV